MAIKVCPCGVYRQLNSILNPFNHISKSSNEFSTCSQFESRKTYAVLVFLSNSKQIHSPEAVIVIHVCYLFKYFVQEINELETKGQL